MSAITTHILDTATGRPAGGVEVTLEFSEGPDKWTALGRGKTNADGRLKDLLKDDAVLKAGTYRLVFLTATYFKNSSLYPSVTIDFKVENPKEHFHIPLLISPYGYSTYRGS